MKATGVLPITDVRMTRFWIRLEEGVQFVLRSLERMEGGEIFVPKLPSMKLTDLAKALAPECRTEIVGIRPGEKLHEVMVPVDDARTTIQHDSYFAILPAFDERERVGARRGGVQCPEGFSYSSDTNTWWLTADEMRDLAGVD
jgi:UDP-N-acetylglucosamine 4,6-dehydratase